MVISIDTTTGTGGIMSNSDAQIDLFEYPDMQPPELRLITEKYSAMDDGDFYEVIRAFLVEVEFVGFTFEYGLDGVPCDLRAIEP